MREEGGIVYKVQNVDPITAGINNVNLDSLNINHHHHHYCMIYLCTLIHTHIHTTNPSDAWTQALLYVCQNE